MASRRHRRDSMDIPSHHKFEWGVRALQKGSSVADGLEIVEKRRDELLAVFEECRSTGTGPSEEVMLEWMALTQLRSELTCKQLDQENRRLVEESIKEMNTVLYGVLYNKVNFGRNGSALERDVRQLLSSVRAYAKSHNIDVTNNSSSRLSNKPQNEAPTASDAAPNKAEPKVSFAPPPPPPPPPPPAAIPSSTTAAATFKAPKPKQQLSSGEPAAAAISQGPPRTPLRPLNNDLLREISSASQLRKTPFPRSPGGTPCRTKRRLSASDSADLIAIALRSKFRQAALDSPASVYTNSPFDSPDNHAFARTPTLSITVTADDPAFVATSPATAEA